MAAIVTKHTRILNADNFIESLTELSSDRLYLGIGRSDVWENEPTPHTVKDSEQTIIDAWNNFIGMKKISSADVKTVIKDSPWTSGSTYKEYDDLAVTLFPKDSNTIQPTYVTTPEGRVYKCIESARNSLGVIIPSTVSPSGTLTTVFSTADGYRWKYMYSVNLSDYNKFATVEYFPIRAQLVANDGSDQWLVQQAAIDGSIEYIHVINGGTGYTDGDAIAAVSSTGVGLVGTIVAPTGTITRINITDAGSGYRDCTINLPATAGDVGEVRAVLSPIGGHGYNAREELEGIYVMVKTVLNGTEGGVLPVDEAFRQVFVLKNPKENTAGVDLILTGYAIDVPFTVGAVIKNTLSVQAEVVAWDAYTGVLSLTNATGVFGVSQTLDIVSGDTGIATISAVYDPASIPAIGTAYVASDVLYGSGKLVYIENRQLIQRNPDQSEDIRLVIEF